MNEDRRARIDVSVNEVNRPTNVLVRGMREINGRYPQLLDVVFFILAFRSSILFAGIYDSFDAFFTRYYDDVTLAAVATEAGTTEQTVLRYFGSKEGLLDAVADRLAHRLGGDRTSVAAGDWEHAVSEAVAVDEIHGERMLLTLAQEDRVAPIKRGTDAGRAAHRETVAQSFSPFLPSPDEPSHHAETTLFIAALDVYTWKLFRIDAGLSRDETEARMKQLVRGVIVELGFADALEENQTTEQSS